MRQLKHRLLRKAFCTFVVASFAVMLYVAIMYAHCWRQFDIEQDSIAKLNERFQAEPGTWVEFTCGYAGTHWFETWLPKKPRDVLRRVTEARFVGCAFATGDGDSLARFSKLHRLELIGCKGTRNMLNAAVNAKLLATLTVQDCDISNKEAQTISLMAQLRILSVSPIDDQGFALLTSLGHLQVLHANSLKLTEQSLEAVDSMTSLETLHLADSGLTHFDAGNLRDLEELEYLVVGGPNLTSCSIVGIKSLRSVRVEGASLEFMQLADLPLLDHLAVASIEIRETVMENLPRLRELRLDRIRAQAITLNNLPQLVTLNLQDARITSITARDVNAITTLFAADSSLTAEQLSNLCGNSLLAAVGLSGTSVDDNFVERIPLSHLTRVDLSRTNVTDTSLRSLTEASRLHYLNISQTDTTEAAIAVLQEQKPHLRIVKDSDSGDSGSEHDS